MKQALCALLSLAFVVSFVGCGGGMSEGLPQSTTPDVPLNTIQTQLKPMKGPLPKGSPTGAPEPAKK